MHPVAPADFHTLAAELEAWRLSETARVKGAGLAAAEEHEALRLLLAKETRLLQTIDRLRVNAAHERRDAKAAAGLGTMAAPKTWELRNGTKVGGRAGPGVCAGTVPGRSERRGKDLLTFRLSHCCPHLWPPRTPPPSAGPGAHARHAAGGRAAGAVPRPRPAAPAARPAPRPAAARALGGRGRGRGAARARRPRRRRRAAGRR
jgi:hypothetical protein